MRNLKRVLSLALASIMLLGMMVVGASAADKTAADLTDIDKVTNKEAVALMVDLGIIVGKPDGSFAPTETVDRATMAKLVYMVLQGDADESIFKGSSALKDVTGNWAEGFINYCYSTNIIAGDGKGNFLPSQKVNTVAAAKMLLVALGYDAADRGYVNDSQWSINIMKDAQKNGLLENVDQKASEELTRDNAAQMIFNALMADTVTPNYDRDMGEKYIRDYSKGNTLGYETYSLVKLTAKVNSIDSDGKADVTLIDPPSGINSNNVTGKINASTNTIGQNVSIYVKANLSFDKDGKVTSATFKEIYTSSVQTSTSTLLATSTKGKTIEELTEKKLGTPAKTNKDYLVSLDEDDVSYFINGELKDTGAAALDAIKAKGVVIEFYDVDGDGLADVVKATQKKVATLTADPKTRINSDDELEVLLKGISNSYVSAVGYEDLSEDDVVLWYKDSANVYHVELADSFTGKVTAVNSDGAVRVDGTYYSASGMAVNVLKDWDDFDNEYDFYTDNGGYIVKAVTSGEKTSDKYAIVLETAWVSGGGVGASKYMEAKILFSDGLTEIVKVSKINDATVIAPKVNGQPVAKDDEVNYEPLTPGNGFYTYTVKNDKYQLTAAANNTKITDAGISATAKFDGVNTANAKTIFVVEKGKDDDKTYTAYTGFSNLPKMVKANGQIVKDGSVATYVFLTTDAFSDDAPDGLFYIKDTSKYSRDSKDNYGYAGYNAEGDEDTLWVDGKLPTGDSNPKSGFFTVGVLTDNIASTDNVKLKTLTELKAIGNDIVEIVDPENSSKTVVKTYDSDTIFVVAEIDNDNKLVDVTTADPSNYDLDTDGYEYKGVVLATDDLANYIYVIATEKPAAEA